MYLKAKGHKKLLHTYLRAARTLHFGLFFANTISHAPEGTK